MSVDVLDVAWVTTFPSVHIHSDRGMPPTNSITCRSLLGRTRMVIVCTFSFVRAPSEESKSCKTQQRGQKRKKCLTNNPLASLTWTWARNGLEERPRFSVAFDVSIYSICLYFYISIIRCIYRCSIYVYVYVCM